MKKVILAELVVAMILSFIATKIYAICQEMDSLVGTECYSFVDHSSWSEIFIGISFILFFLIVDAAGRIRKILKK